MSTDSRNPVRPFFSRPLTILGLVLAVAGQFSILAMAGRIMWINRRTQAIDREIDKLMLTEQPGYRTVRDKGAIWFEKPYILIDRNRRRVGSKTQRVLFYDLSKEESEQAALSTERSSWKSWLWMGTVPLGLGIAAVGIDTIFSLRGRSPSPATIDEFQTNTATADNKIADPAAMPESLGGLFHNRN